MATNGSADLVIVANRLPVDRVYDADGTPSWRRSPGGLVSALEPVLRQNDGAWIGWPGGDETDLEPFTEDGLRLVPVALSAAGDRGVLRGLLQRHPVAALPRPGRQAGVPPRVVGRLRRGQPALRRGRGRGRREGRHGLGAGLPAAAGAADAARAAARPADRLLPAHPVPADRAVPAAAVAPPDPRGPARRRPDRLPAVRRRRQLRAPGPPAGRPQHAPRHRRPARRPHRAGRNVPHLDRHRGVRGARPLRGR